MPTTPPISPTHLDQTVIPAILSRRRASEEEAVHYHLRNLNEINAILAKRNAGREEVLRLAAQQRKNSLKPGFLDKFKLPTPPDVAARRASEGSGSIPLQSLARRRSGAPMRLPIPDYTFGRRLSESEAEPLIATGVEAACVSNPYEPANRVLLARPEQPVPFHSRRSARAFYQLSPSPHGGAFDDYFSPHTGSPGQASHRFEPMPDVGVSPPENPLGEPITWRDRCAMGGMMLGLLALGAPVVVFGIRGLVHAAQAAMETKT